MPEFRLPREMATGRAVEEIRFSPKEIPKSIWIAIGLTGFDVA
jgi:hypothetical protein